MTSQRALPGLLRFHKFIYIFISTKNFFFTFCAADSGFCEKIDSEDCPKSLKAKRELNFGKVDTEWKTADEYLRIMLNEAIDMMDLIITMGLTALAILVFTLGYYCINRARKEGPLIAKVNFYFRSLPKIFIN